MHLKLLSHFVIIYCLFQAYINGESKPYVPQTKFLSMGTSVLAPIEIPSEDRNRTSPFPYGGHRFEFRAVGSSQVIHNHDIS